MEEATHMWQIGVVVEDIETAKADLGAAASLTWVAAERTLDVSVGGERMEITLKIALSTQGPVHLELIEGQEGTPWWPPHGFDHVAKWSDDLNDQARRLEDAGFIRQISYFDETGEVRGFTYHRSPSGFRLEHVDASRREDMMAWLSGGTFPAVEA